MDGWGISCEIALIWMALDFIDDQSTLVQVMAWCRQATSHYLSQCWPRSLSLYGVTRPQWVKNTTLLTVINFPMEVSGWLRIRTRITSWIMYDTGLEYSTSLLTHCGLVTLIWYCRYKSALNLIQMMVCWLTCSVVVKIYWNSHQCISDNTVNTHGCWCPGDLQRQASSSHDIEHAGLLGPFQL